MKVNLHLLLKYPSHEISQFQQFFLLVQQIFLNPMTQEKMHKTAEKSPSVNQG